MRIIAVTPPRRCADADRIAAREGVHRLLVIDGGRLADIVCRRDLQRSPGERVRTVMQHDIAAIDAATGLGAAAAMMRASGVGCLPVAREGRLVGTITRGDLVRAGVSAEKLG